MSFISEPIEYILNSFLFLNVLNGLSHSSAINCNRAKDNKLFDHNPYSLHNGFNPVEFMGSHLIPITINPVEQFGF